MGRSTHEGSKIYSSFLLITRKLGRGRRSWLIHQSDSVTPRSRPTVYIVYRLFFERRFDRSATSAFYADLTLLHPRNFGQVPSGAMEQLHKYLVRFDADISAQLRTELQSLADQWPTLKQSISDVYKLQEDSDDEPGSEKRIENLSHESCKGCPLCCYKGLLNLNLFTDAYKSIGLAYKLLLTPPVSQVACARSFSALKRIKNRLRSTMTQEHLEAFMLMSVEKRILAKLDTTNLIDSVAVRSIAKCGGSYSRR